LVHILFFVCIKINNTKKCNNKTKIQNIKKKDGS